MSNVPALLPFLFGEQIAEEVEAVLPLRAATRTY
jgi:hypothetical protein